MHEFKLPDLGEGIHEGEILKWHVATGDAIREDDPLVDVETDKAAVTIPSPRGGRIASLGGKPGDTVKVGQVLAVIDDGSGGEAKAADRSQPAARGPVVAAPATRRVARELGVDIATVAGTGPAGRVTAEDVRRAASGGKADAPAPAGALPVVSRVAPAATDQPAAAPLPGGVAIPLLDLSPLPDFAAQGPVDREPLRSIRKATARNMVTSLTLIPHVAHMDEADVTELEAMRKADKERNGGTGRYTLLAVAVKAVAGALKRHPPFNATLDPWREEIVYKRFCNVGVAVATDRGLIVPVVRDADRKSVVEIAEEVRSLAGRARDGTLGLDELRGGTFTITNIGALGGTGFVPAIRYPESAILGMGRVAEKPVVRDGQVVVRTLLPLVLSFDHRIADGADAARFVNTVSAWLADPARMLVEV